MSGREQAPQEPSEALRLPHPLVDGTVIIVPSGETVETALPELWQDETPKPIDELIDKNGVVLDYGPAV